VTFDLPALDRYVVGLAKALYTRGFELPANPSALRDPSGTLRFSILGVIPGSISGADSEIVLEEIWATARDGQWMRREYAYELIDRARHRRRAFHMHDGGLERRLGVSAHEHCEEELGVSGCQHYVGRELPHGYLGLELLVAAWVESGPLGCDHLTCLE
jgi:hypothetical protein